MNNRYRIVYTESAIQDMEEKVDYISFNLHDPGLAETWYLRLRAEILKDLAQFPYKIPSILSRSGVLRGFGNSRFAMMSFFILSMKRNKSFTFGRFVRKGGI